MTRPALLITALIFSISSYSQAPPGGDKPMAPPRNELVLGHGHLPSDEIFAGRSQTEYNSVTATGAVFVTYRYRVSPFVGIALSAAYEHETGAWEHSRHSKEATDPYIFGRFTRTCMSVVPEVIFYPQSLKQGRMQYYALAGAGITYREQETIWDNHYASKFSPPSFYHDASSHVPNPAKWHLNGQLSPVCFRYGGSLGAFIEFGVGYKGLVCYGVTYRF